MRFRTTSLSSSTTTTLSDHWLLPTAVKDTIHGVAGLGEGSSQDIVDTVKAARIFTASTMNDRQYDADSLSADPHVVTINLYPDDVQQLLQKADSIHDTINALSL